RALARELVELQEACWRKLRAELAGAGVSLVDARDVTADERAWLSTYFLEQVFPVVTPLAIDPAHPFPFIPNGGFALVLQLHRGADGKGLRGLLPLPSQIARFIRLPGEQVRFVLIEEMIGLFLDRLFPGFEVVGAGQFRINRDSEMEIAEEAEDLVMLFE